MLSDWGIYGDFPTFALKVVVVSFEVLLYLHSK